MTKLLSILSLILAIVLFPPATLAVISNNAVPGDTTYPIKRGLENVIFVIVSINPTSKAWFSQARSDRRFKEFSTLIVQGKQAGQTLNELVEQTQVTASQIAQVNDQTQKQQLIEQLSQSIKKYDQGLQQVSSPVAPLSQATPTPQPGQTPASVVQPTSRPTPTSQPTPAPTPTPNPHREDEERERQRQREIEEARKRLEEIRKRLEDQQIRQESNDKKEDKHEKKEDKKETKQEEKGNSNLTPKIKTGNPRP